MATLRGRIDHSDSCLSCTQLAHLGSRAARKGRLQTRRCRRGPQARRDHACDAEIRGSLRPKDRLRTLNPNRERSKPERLICPCRDVGRVAPVDEVALSIRTSASSTLKTPREAPTCGGPVPTAETTMHPVGAFQSAKGLTSQQRLDNRISSDRRVGDHQRRRAKDRRRADERCAPA